MLLTQVVTEKKPYIHFADTLCTNCLCGWSHSLLHRENLEMIFLSLFECFSICCILHSQDYLVLLPSDYYEASLLQIRVTEPCTHPRPASAEQSVDKLQYKPLPWFVLLSSCCT